MKPPLKIFRQENFRERKRRVGLSFSRENHYSRQSLDEQDMVMRVDQSFNNNTVTVKRGRKSKSAQKKEKQPQRGLGVEKLEILREEMEKIPGSHQVHHHGHASDHHQIVNTHHQNQNQNQTHHFQYHQFPSFLENQHHQPQQNSISVPGLSRFGPQMNYGGATPTHTVTAINGPQMNYGARPIVTTINGTQMSYGSTPTITTINGAQLMSSSHPALVFHQPHPAYKLAGNGGYPGLVSGLRPILPNLPNHHFEGDRLRIAQEPQFQNGNPNLFFESAKVELSSNPKLHCLSEQCDMCLKKKRINGENLGFDGVNRTTQYTETKQINSRDYLELDLGRNRNVHGQIYKDCGSNGVIPAAYPGVHDHEEEEVMVGVHQKGKSVRGRRPRSVLMEYEFFPTGSSTSGSLNKESLMVESAKTGSVVGEPSQSNTNFLDLSLKLSC